MSIKGYLDGIKDTSIEGWCFDIYDIHSPVLLNIYLNGQFSGQTLAENPRIGIKNKGIHPTGNCGFNYQIEGHKIEDITKIEVKTANSREQLKNSPMNIKTNRLKIFYMHIPKTAGSSLNSDISLSFPGINKKSHIEGVLGSEHEEILHSKNFLSGHITFPKIIEKFPLHKWDFITLLRNPIDQLESHINWVIKVTEDEDSKFHKGHGNVIKKISYEIREMDLTTKSGKKKFLEKTKSNSHYRNLFENCQTKYFSGTHDRFVNSNDLYNALKTLQSTFLFVGLSSEYNAFLKVLAKHYGFDYVAPKERKNINKKKQKFFSADHELDLANDLIRFDNILFQYTKIKWQELQLKLDHGIKT